VKFECRPCYVIQMTQLDRNYIYGRRVLYIEAETFFYHLILNYDQKGRLYRTMWPHYSFIPDMGNVMLQYFNGAAFIDLHSQISPAFAQPAPWITREHTSMQYIIKKGK
jgi:hypothetical protein